MHRLMLFCSWFTLVLAWTAVNHYPPWVTSHSELLAAVSAALLATGTWKRSAGDASRRIAIPFVAIAVAAAGLVPIVQWLCGLIFFFGDAWIASLYLFCGAWAISWSTTLARSDAPGFAVALAWSFLIGALINAAIQQVQIWGIDVGPLSLYVASVRPGYAAFGNLAQPNLLADLLLLGLASTMYLFERHMLGKASAALLAVLLTSCLAMTQSRAVALVMCLAILWHMMLRDRAVLRTPRWAMALFAAGWAAMFLLWPGLLRSLHMPVLATVADRMQAGPRTVIYQQLWDAIWLRPWFGYGWNQVSVAQIAVAADHPRSRLVEHSHNLLLDLALWNGVPLALIMIVGAAAALLWAARRVKTPTAAFALLIVLLFLTHSLVEFPLEFLYFLVPFCLAVGILVAETGLRNEFALTLSARAGGAAVLLFTLALAAAAIDYWRMEAAHRDMRFTVARYGRPMPVQPPEALRSQFTQLAAFHRFALYTPSPGMPATEIEWMRKVAHRYGYAPSLYRYALAQAFNGDVSGASQTMLQLRQLHGEERYLEGKNDLKQLESEYPAMRELQLP